MPLKTVEITGALYPAIVEVNQGPQGPPGTVGDVEWNDLTGTVDVVPFTTTNGGPVNKGELAWTQEDETLTLALNYGTMLQLGEEVLYHVDNNTGTNIANGTPVMYAGTVGNSGRMRVKPWDGTDPMAYMGVATSAIATGSSGYVAHFGKVRGIQTNGANYGETWVNGDIIYTKTGSAGLTKTKPTTGNYAVVAAVISAHASNGTLFVRRSVERNIVSADIGDATDDATAQPGKILRSSGSGSLSVTELNASSFYAGSLVSPSITASAATIGSAYVTSLSLGAALSIANGGTGSTTVDGARSNLGAVGLTGNETIAGNKTLTGQLELSASQAATNPESAMTRDLIDQLLMDPAIFYVSEDFCKVADGDVDVGGGFYFASTKGTGALRPMNSSPLPGLGILGLHTAASRRASCKICWDASNLIGGGGLGFWSNGLVNSTTSVKQRIQFNSLASSVAFGFESYSIGAYKTNRFFGVRYSAPASPWTPSTVMTLDEYRRPTVANGRRYFASVGGTTGVSEPTWPTTAGGTVVDGTVTWTEDGLDGTSNFILHACPNTTNEGGLSTVVDTGVIAAVSTWYEFEMSFVSGNTWRFRINGAVVGDLVMPSVVAVGTVVPVFKVESHSASAVQLDIDYFKMFSRSIIR